MNSSDDGTLTQEAWEDRQRRWEHLESLLNDVRRYPGLLSRLAEWEPEDWTDASPQVVRERCAAVAAERPGMPEGICMLMVGTLQRAFWLGWSSADMLALCDAVAPYRDDDDFWLLMDEVTPSAQDVLTWVHEGWPDVETLETLLALGA